MCFGAPAFACKTLDAYGNALQQNWPAQDRAVWYETSQGSRLIPLDWHAALRLRGQTTRLAEPANLARYAPQICQDTGLPLGFVIDADAQRPPAMGLTCAACHTGFLSDGTSTFVVEGGANGLDLQTYAQDLFDAVEATWRDYATGPGPVWSAFAGDVLGRDHSETEAAQLHADMTAWLNWRGAIQRSIADGGRWGHGRIDAVAVIQNTISKLAGLRAGDRLPAASAPVSNPAVWNAPQMAQVQWNGSSLKVSDIGLFDDISLGALTRNSVEVLGVFAEMNLADSAFGDRQAYPSITSSVRMGNLIALERSLRSLRSPAWPENHWGAIDRKSDAYRRGAALFDAGCSGCHQGLDRTDLTVSIGRRNLGRPATDGTEIQTVMVPAFDLNAPDAPGYGVSPLMACNALTHASWSGKFANLDNSYKMLFEVGRNKDLSALWPEKFPSGVETMRLVEEMALRMIYEKRAEINAVQRADLRQKLASLGDGLRAGLFGDGRDDAVDPATATAHPTPTTHSAATLAEARALCAEVLLAQDPSGATVPAYKARPLNGIWATPPFLHNGSVPTLDDLLLPPGERPTQFATGAVLFDPVRVGLAGPSGQGPVSLFEVQDTDGRVIPGNWNGGHDFRASKACYDPVNTAQCKDDRAALILYLKGL